jgi:hypothetical protein
MHFLVIFYATVSPSFLLDLYFPKHSLLLHPKSVLLLHSVQMQIWNEANENLTCG